MEKNHLILVHIVDLRIVGGVECLFTDFIRQTPNTEHHIILIDKNIIEIFINGGEKIFTYLVYPERYNYELTGNIKGNIIEIKN